MARLTQPLKRGPQAGMRPSRARRRVFADPVGAGRDAASLGIRSGMSQLLKAQVYFPRQRYTLRQRAAKHSLSVCCSPFPLLNNPLFL